MEAYKKFVRQNKEFVRSLESLANGITWLLPERFSNSEIGPEAVYAFLGIVGSLNQHIIDTTPKRGPPWKPVHSSFPWSVCISALKDLEAVVEVAAQQFYGDDGKWNFIAFMEATKVLARLALLRESGCKMLLQGGEVVNESNGEDDSVIYLHDTGSIGRPGSGNGNHGYYCGSPHSLEGRAMSALNRFGQDARMVSDQMRFSRLQASPEFRDAPAKKTSLSTIWFESGLAGRLLVTEEIIFMMRPLIYVLFIRKFGMKSWIPWLVSLVVDVTGMTILTHIAQPDRSRRKGLIAFSASEKDEVKRRKLLWALYVMRDPFFTKFTRCRLENTEKYLNQVPLIGFLTEKLVELLIGAQTRYTYTSGLQRIQGFLCKENYSNWRASQGEKHKIHTKTSVVKFKSKVACLLGQEEKGFPTFLFLLNFNQISFNSFLILFKA